MRRLHHSTRLWLYVLVGVALLLSAMLLPGSAVAWFYSDATAPGRWLVRLEQTAFPFSRWFHVAMFAWLALCLCRLFPRQPRWHLTVGPSLHGKRATALYDPPPCGPLPAGTTCCRAGGHWHCIVQPGASAHGMRLQPKAAQPWE